MSLLAGALFVVLVAAACARRPSPVSPHHALAAVGAAVFAALPYLAPPSAWPVRVLLCGYGLTVATKLWTWLTGAGPRDELTCATRSRFAVWLLVPSEIHWPRDPKAARASRIEGAWRLGRFALKAAFTLGLVGAKHAVASGGVLFWALTAVEFYGFLSALADATNGTLMVASGAAVDEVFRRPFLATSPADFWGRRWNLYIGGFLRRQIFAPLARRHHAALGVFASFVASGLLHEHMVLSVEGVAHARLGFMMAFFALAGGAVLLQHAVHKALPARLGIAAHIGAVIVHTVWIVTTSRLFFAPLGGVVSAFDAVGLSVLRRFVP